MYKDGGIVDKIFMSVDNYRRKRLIKSAKKFIGKRWFYDAVCGFDHNGHRYTLRIQEVR